MVTRTIARTPASPDSARRAADVSADRGREPVAGPQDAARLPEDGGPQAETPRGAGADAQLEADRHLAPGRDGKAQPAVADAVHRLAGQHRELDSLAGDAAVGDVERESPSDGRLTSTATWYVRPRDAMKRTGRPSALATRRRSPSSEPM